MPGNAQARTRLCECAKLLRDGFRIAADVKRVPDARKHGRDDASERRRDRQRERVTPRRFRHGDPAYAALPAAVDRERAGVATFVDDFDARHGARAQEVEQRFPVVRRPVGELEAHRRWQRCRRGVLAQPRWRHPVARAEQRVEAPQAAESARQRDVE